MTVRHCGKERGIFEVDEDRAAEAFRLMWGLAYDIGSPPAPGGPVGSTGTAPS